MPDKTWTQLETAIEETFRKWRLNSPILAYTIAKRSAAKRVQSKEERSVAIEFDVLVDHKYRRVRLVMVREERAIENLEKIAQAVEWLRMAYVRDIIALLVPMFRQMYPLEMAPPLPRGQSHGPYAVLHVVDDAPLEVCEAAYKALTKKHHPDLGGDTATMQRLNGAIAQIRQEQT